MGFANGRDQRISVQHASFFEKQGLPFFDFGTEVLCTSLNTLNRRSCSRISTRLVETRLQYDVQHARQRPESEQNHNDAVPTLGRVRKVIADGSDGFAVKNERTRINTAALRQQMILIERSQSARDVARLNDAALLDNDVVFLAKLGIFGFNLPLQVSAKR